MSDEIQEKEVATWIRIPIGIVLTAIILLCIAGVATIFFDLPKGNRLFAVALGSVLTLLSLWGLSKSLRMVFGWRRREVFFSSKTLTLISYVFLSLPIVGIFTSYYSEHRVLGPIQAAVNVLIFLKLRTFARSREEESPTSQG